METINFQCDFCGVKSEEESAVWRRPRCSIELVLRGSRFATVSSSHSLYGLPPGLGATPETAEDERWAATLCDRCMKRVAALFGLSLETPEEARWRETEFARHLAAASRAANAPVESGMRGVMTDQFLTPPVPHVAARTSPSAPVSVIQYETPKRATAAPKEDAEGKSVEENKAAPGTLERGAVGPGPTERERGGLEKNEKNEKDKPAAEASDG